MNRKFLAPVAFVVSIAGQKGVIFQNSKDFHAFEGFIDRFFAEANVLKIFIIAHR
jgi:hypothetical protein